MAMLPAASKPRGVQPTWDDVVEGQPVDSTTGEALWAERVIGAALEKHLPHPRQTNDAEVLFRQLEELEPDNTELMQALKLQRRFLGLEGIPYISEPDMTFRPDRERGRWEDKKEMQDIMRQGGGALERRRQAPKPQDAGLRYRGDQ